MEVETGTVVFPCVAEAMSAVGQFRTSMRPSGRSALRLATDIVCVAGQVRKVPTGDKAHPVRKKPQLRRPQKIVTESRISRCIEGSDLMVVSLDATKARMES